MPYDGRSSSFTQSPEPTSGRAYIQQETIPLRTFGTRFDQQVPSNPTMPSSFNPEKPYAQQETVPFPGLYDNRNERFAPYNPNMPNPFVPSRQFMQRQSPSSPSPSHIDKEPDVQSSSSMSYSYSFGTHQQQQRDYNVSLSRTNIDSTSRYDPFPRSSSLDESHAQKSVNSTPKPQSYPFNVFEDSKKTEQECLNELKTTCSVSFSDGCTMIFIVATAYIRDFTGFVLNFSLPNTSDGIMALTLFTECFVVYKSIINLDLEKRTVSLKPGFQFPTPDTYPDSSSFDEETIIDFLSYMRKYQESR